MVLRKTFGSNREKGTECCRKLHNEKLKYYSDDKTKGTEIGGAGSTYGFERYA
jgi:hypothetical protein